MNFNNPYLTRPEVANSILNYLGINNTQEQQQPQNKGVEGQIKGKYINSLEDVVALQSNDLEPSVCVNFSTGKIYVKMFSIDGGYKIEEFIKNPDFTYDSRSEIDKVKEQMQKLEKELEALKSENEKLKGGNTNGQQSSNNTKNNK